MGRSLADAKALETRPRSLIRGTSPQSQTLALFGGKEKEVRKLSGIKFKTRAGC